LERGTGEKERRFMKKKDRYTNKFASDNKINPKNLKVIEDFLPDPVDLASDKVKITLEIDKETYEFFQILALQNKTKYQPLIREVLRIYAKKFKSKLAS
jgi:hypothetical protein